MKANRKQNGVKLTASKPGRSLTQFMKKSSSYIFLLNQVKNIFLRNSLIREDAAFCFVINFGFILV